MEKPKVSNFELPGKKIETEEERIPFKKETLKEYEHSHLGEHPHDFVVFHNPLSEEDRDLQEQTVNEHKRFLIFAEEKETGKQRFFFLSFNILKTESGDKISSTEDFEIFQSYIRSQSSEKSKNCFIQVNKNATTIHFPGKSKALVAATMYEKIPEEEDFESPVSLEKAQGEDIEKALNKNKREKKEKILDRII
jgi:hypothetical protein